MKIIDASVCRDKTVKKRCLSMRQCLPSSPWSECASVRVHIDKTAKAVLFPMLSGRLQSHDQ